MNPEILLGHQLLGFLGLLPAPSCWHPNFQWDFTMEGPGFGPGDNGPMYAFYPNSGYSWLRGGKGQVLEGGVRTPSMAWWPGMILANQEPVDLLHITVPWRLFGTWKSWGNSWNTWGFEPKNREKHQMCLIVFRISRHISHSCSTFFFSKCSQVFAIAHMIFFHMFIFSFANVTQFYPPFFPLHHISPTMFSSRISTPPPRGWVAHWTLFPKIEWSMEWINCRCSCWERAMDGEKRSFSTVPWRGDVVRIFFMFFFGL